MLFLVTYHGYAYKYEHCFVYTTIIDQLGGKQQFNIIINGLKSRQFTSIVLYNKLDCSSLMTCVFGVPTSTTYLVLADIANCKLSLHILQSTFNLICRIIHFTHCGCQLQYIGIFCHRTMMQISKILTSPSQQV